ncbi:MAG: hypothetical protein Q4B54_01785 [Coriobacteriales bacterium]|nr:hypothetical protein [Coriobacteriales bacterium]
MGDTKIETTGARGVLRLCFSLALAASVSACAGQPAGQLSGQGAAQSQPASQVETIAVGDKSIAIDATQVDATNFSAEQIAQLQDVLPRLSKLSSVNFGSEDGMAKLSAVSQFHKVAPQLALSYSFNLFGQMIDFNATELDFRGIQMDDQGAQVRCALEAMPNVARLDMDSCGVDDEHMAAIRDDFPQVEVIWRVWFGTNYTVRTDATKILASAPGLGGMLSPENTEGLKYCTKMKYLDIGHNDTLQDISFVSYMPDLEVFICMWGNITDISPLASCSHLEFLEIFTNDITDLTPLANLHELRHLNASNNPHLSDITPVYNLTGLERFWCGQYHSVPQEQFDEFRRRVPNCATNFTCYDPHEDWRWGTERYALLQEQLGYLEGDYQTPERDPLYPGN